MMTKGPVLKKNRKKTHQTGRKKIHFSSKPENLVLVEKMIDDICEQHYIGEDHYGNLLVSVTEAVNNAIQHGNKFDPEKSVVVAYEVDSDRKMMTFTIEDQGGGFDHSDLPDPTDPENVEKLNGRGIFLMRRLSDGVGFSNNGSVVKINFKISAN